MYGPGLPADAPRPECAAFARIDAAASSWAAGAPAAALGAEAWTTHEWLRFRSALPGGPTGGRLAATARRLGAWAGGAPKSGAALLQVGAATRRGVMTQTAVRLGALLLLVWLAFRWARKKKRDTISAARPGLWLGGLLTGVGLLFFAPWLLSRHHLWVDWLSRPLGEWDLLLSASLHRYLPLANMLVPVALTLLLLGVRGAQSWLAGFALGTAAYLVSVAVLGQLATPFGWLITTAWCLLHALGCLWMATLLIAERR